MSFRIVPAMYPIMKRPSKYYKLMTLLFMTLHITFGLDVGFFSNKSFKFRWFINIITFVRCVVFGLFIVLELRNTNYETHTCWAAAYYLQYMICIVTLTLVMRGTTFANLNESLAEIDVKLRVDFSDNRTELKVILLICVIYLERFFVIGTYCLVSSLPLCLHSVWNVYMFVFKSSCADVCLLCYSFVFYSLYLRLAKVNSMLEAYCYNVHNIQHIYEKIIDTVEIYKNVFDPLYALLFLCNVPQITMAIYITVKNIQTSTETVASQILAVEYLHALHILVVSLAPALTAEMLTTQAEKIKTILNDQKLLRGIQDKDILTRFIRYVEARPCRFRVWQLIPLSADLLGMVLSFCVTYLIVIIQFTTED